MIEGWRLKGDFRIEEEEVVIDLQEDTAADN